MNLILCNYNNYFNRIGKWLNTPQDYLDNDDEHKSIINNINFKESDGLITSQVVNWNLDWDPTYLVVYTGNNLDDPSCIVSRWFITKTEVTRNNQLQLTLKRDTIADYNNQLYDATAYIDKGYVDPSNKLFLNKDGISANQIKQAEYLIGDLKETGSLYTATPWVVGYVANKWDSSEIAEDDVQIKVPGSTFNWNGWNNFPLKKFITGEGSKKLVYVSDIKAKIRLGTGFLSSDGWVGYIRDLQYNVAGAYISDYGEVKSNTASSGDDIGNISSTYSYYKWPKYHADSSYLPVLNASSLDRASIRQTILDTGFSGMDGISNYLPVSGIVKQGNNYYKVTVTEVTQRKSVQMTQAVIDKFKDACTCKEEMFTMTGSRGTYTVERYFDVNVALITDDVLASQTYVANFAGAWPLNDAPYKMFCFPLPTSDDLSVQGGYTYLVEDSSGSIKQYEYGKQLSKDDVLQLMGGLVTGLGGNLYDIQILPYCPIRGGDMKYAGYTDSITYTCSENVHITKIMDGDTLIAPIFWSARSTFKFNVPYTLTISYDQPLKAKRWVNTCFARLVSPNHANTFEFGIVQNGGINGFEIDCQYKPFSPHIHVAPVFGGIYGKNWNDDPTHPYYVDKVDVRGLICGGDFSFPQTSSQWVNYQLDNKNYQLQFNREIDTLELNQSYAEKSALINGITGVVTGSVKGAATGAMVGGGYGAAAGAVIGGAAGLVDLAYNYNETKTLGRDAIDLKQDLFQYNLANIQARPNNITNIGALNPDFRFYPYCEIYQESLDEVTPIENKLKYEGFNIGVVGKVSDYIGTEDTTDFIRGAITRITDVPAHISQDIAEELARGLYMKGVK